MARDALVAFAAVFERSALPAAPVRWEIRLLAALLIAATVVRVWGLGNVGLHEPDEDTVALPALHLAQHGEPLFPSGMYYARAIVQTYLIAGSINAFGNSESALRLPSVVAGILVVLLAYFIGRRFLQPAVNLAMVATLALLPELIMQSQTARMYIFLVACVAIHILCVFAWERSGRVIYVLGALLAVLLGIQFQALMIFSVLLFFYPGLLGADPRKLWIGAMAVAVGLVGYVVIDDWITAFYYRGDPADIAAVLGLPGAAVHLDERTTSQVPVALVLAAIGVAASCAALACWRVQDRMARVTVGALIFLGLVAQLLLNYHIAAVLLTVGTVVALRSRVRARYALWVLAAICLVTTVAHVIWLNAQGIDSLGKIVSSMMGVSSIWSFLNYAPVSYGATLLAVAGAGLALRRVAQGGKISDVWLFALLGVWAPLFLIGCFAGYPEYRYMTPVLLPFLIMAFATVQGAWAWLSGRAQGGVPRLAAGFLLVVAIVLVVNPFKVAAVVNPSYGFYPDHKGAAQFLKSVPLRSGDIVVAEDAIMQTYYLGSVDYWLTKEGDALRFGRVVNSEVRDNYTDARIIVTAAQLQSLLGGEASGDVYVVGTGEGWVKGRPAQRTREIDEIIRKLEVVYEGRDGLTMVWKLSAAR